MISWLAAVEVIGSGTNLQPFVDNMLSTNFYRGNVKKGAIYPV